jgi:hypothetical protein
MRTLPTASLLALALFVAGQAAAHHAFSANYDANNLGTIEGTVEEVAWSNPHVHYYIQVTNDDGTTELWDGEAHNITTMTRRGWDRDTLRVGDAIRVTGALGRHGSRRIEMREVVRSDGRPLIKPTD